MRKHHSADLGNLILGRKCLLFTGEGYVSLLTAYSVYLSARRSLKEMCRYVTDLFAL